MRGAWVVALFLCGCPAPSARRAAIIGGSRDTADPAVMLLVSWPPDQSASYTCTASLIAPSLLLTAAHCVDAANHPNHDFGVYPGDDASGFATLAQLIPQLAAVSAVHPHPQYDPLPPFTADIAVVELAAPLAVTPLPFARQAPSVGAAARIVGYGQTQYGTYNAAKYQALTSVASVPAGDTVVVGDAQHRSCVGDSGGPALVNDTVIGVDSYTDTTGCTEPAHYRRSDLYLSFIDPYLPSMPDLGTMPRDLAQPDLAQPDLAEAIVARESGGCEVTATASSRPFWFLIAAGISRAWWRRRACAPPATCPRRSRPPAR
jgi:secreted trypsin-like serine protease